MPLLHKKSLFFHIPKTGGNWVRSALRASCDVQLELQDHTFPMRVTSDYYKFCFVRHPLTWYKSFFNYRNSRKWQSVKRMELDNYSCGDFNVFIKRVCKYTNGFLTSLFKKYTQDVDFVGKQENLVDDLVTALKSAGETFDEGKLRGTQRLNLSDSESLTYDVKLEQRLQHLEIGAIEEYKYEVLNGK